MPGVSFLTAGADAVWIVDKALAGPTGEPAAPYNGGQFAIFAPSSGGKRIQVFDKNDDGKVYQYALRFLLTTAPDGQVVMDPTIKNGGVPP